MKKITLSTLKSFIKKNQEKLLIQVRGSFDAMDDCISFSYDRSFSKIKKSHLNPAQDSYTLGISGVWLVGNSRDHFRKLEHDNFEGIEVSNCCGYFTLAIPKIK